MTAIDLSKDLELWCDFDTRYFDAQRNKIQDRSGHGRHAEASGGPTLGVSGPDGFEVASLDGSDDEFVTPYSDNPTGDISAALLFKYNSSTNRGILFGQQVKTRNNGIGWSLQGDGSNNRNPRFLINDGANKVRASSGYEMSVGQWHLVVGRSETDQHVIEVFDSTGERVATDTDTTTRNAEISSGGLSLRYMYDNFSHQPCDVAFAGFWNRFLSDAEVSYLNRLNAPRRTQL